jgi:glycosyltransferase involved in cell wall biosynthesis
VLFLQRLPANARLTARKAVQSGRGVDFCALLGLLSAGDGIGGAVKGNSGSIDRVTNRSLDALGGAYGRTIVIAANSSWNLVNFRGNIIAALQQRGFRVVAIAPRDAHSGQLEAMAVEFHAFDFRSAGISPLHDAGLFLRYLGLLRRIRPAALLGFTIKPNIYGSLAARLLGIPVVNNVSGLGTAFIKQGMITRVATFLYRQAFRRSATVFFQNDEDRQTFVAAGMVAADCTRLLPGSGVDLDRFVPTPLPTGNPFRFLLIARLLWDKGVQEYVDAARSVRARHPDTRFQILGFTDVDNRTAVPRVTLDRWVGEGLIDYLGAADDVRPLIEAADCIVLPSYREGLPRSLLEASAMARPIVATDVAGVRDVVDDGVTGLLCAARSASSLAEAMLAMIAMSPAERRAMGQAGRSRVEGGFGIGEVTRRYLEAIDDALTHPERGSGVKALS